VELDLFGLKKFKRNWNSWSEALPNRALEYTIHIIIHVGPNLNSLWSKTSSNSRDHYEEAPGNPSPPTQPPPQLLCGWWGGDLWMGWHFFRSSLLAAASGTVVAGPPPLIQFNATKWLVHITIHIEDDIEEEAQVLATVYWSAMTQSQENVQ
jgi:hypothetical protein